MPFRTGQSSPIPVRNNTNRVPYFKDCPKPLTFSPRNIIIIKRTKFACLAQPVEHAAVNRSVGGSSPSTGAIVAARRTSQQLSVPRRVVCMYACGSSSRRKNARRSLCSSFLRNYRTALSFLLRGAASPQFLFLFSFYPSNPLTLFSPCTTFACRSDGENSLFRHFVPYGGSSPSTGAI